MTFFGKYPKIYGTNADDFSANGYGFLPDGQYCDVKEKLNGGLELEMSYPVTGQGFEYLVINATILAPVNPYDNWQPFRIYSITRAQNGFVKVNAEHKAYELSGYPCLPNDDYIETPGTCAQLMSYLQSEAARTAQALGNPAYTFTTDITDSTNWSITAPTDIWSVMAQAVSWYGGEWKYDGTECRLCEKRGDDRHVKVQYGSNLSELSQGEIDTSYTHILPYWTNGTDTVYINGLITIAAHTEERMQRRVLILDMSESFETEPTQQELYDAAVAWEQEDKNKPKGVEKTLKVKFVPRGQTMEYASLGDIDHVELGDDIDCENNPLGVTGQQRCIALTYDVYRGRYKLAELGKPAQTIATADIKQSKGQRDKTVWVSVTEPTDGYIYGDYWIKIDNEVTRVAQGLGRYTGGKWLLLCEFGGGGGVGEDLGNHNERFNDYEDNTVAGGSYMHVEGAQNAVTYGGYCGHIGGYNNSIASNEQSIVSGRDGSIGRAYCALIIGDDIAVSNINVGLVSGKEHQGVAYNVIVGGIGHTLSNSQDGLVTGYYNTDAGNYNAISGANNTVSSNYNIVGGSGNNVSNSNSNIVSGEGNYVNGIRSLVVGGGHGTSSNKISPMDSIVCGHGHNGGIDYGIVCGMSASLSQGDRIVVGNGGSGTASNCFRVDNQGNVYASVYNTSGADYAEYFEWIDGNTNNEDRRGLLVQLVGADIIPADGDDILGAVSSRPSVIGNAYEEHWRGKYKQDIYGDFILDENGNRQLSEEYDANREYIPRSKRPEWAVIGIAGRLIIRDNGKCQPGGYCTARKGVGYPSLKQTRVLCLKRLDDKHVEVLIRG